MNGKPRLLDLFCGAGGAAKGYADAGFEVIGVDIVPQPHYPFEFWPGNALSMLAYLLDGGLSAPRNTPALALRQLGYFDAVHASPPCQAFTDMRTMWNAGRHDDLLTPTRAMLRRTGLPYIIENVEGAPMPEAVRLCGSTFGLGVERHGAELRRHRLFECSFAVLVPPCYHADRTIGIYGDHARDRRRTDSERGKDYPDKDKLPLASEAMGIDWMNWREISQAIPPAYTEFLGTQLLEHLNRTSLTKRDLA